MLKALVLKELRELAPIVAIALAVYACIVAQSVGLELAFWPIRPSAGIPFVTDDFTYQITCVSICLAIALGMRQTVSESVRGTWVWLLHRPASATRLLTIKLIVGGITYLVCSASPIAFYACWAAMPGTHASPFSWAMTADAWQSLISAGVLYLASFMCGLWPVRWFGPRLLPLAGIGALVMFCWVAFSSVVSWSGFVWVVPVLLGPLLLTNIFAITRMRDFS
jgi:hypothetical protein